MSEGVPLNSTGAANIFLNTGKNTKVNSPEGTVIHLNTGDLLFTFLIKYNIVLRHEYVNNVVFY